jgi:hypothetical protein
MAHDIYSRGRFGAWKYEIGNMDHSVKMGIDIARFMVKGIPRRCGRDGTTRHLFQ